ncbi:MAG TPA: lysophospholipid acyltransferase family protein [Candidatus Binatia bacterium]|jgi:1-acyl-sn-glycerol-3-phosphate acyltransferase
MIAALLAGLSRLISGASVRWVDCRPDARQRLYFANHTSHLDFVLIWSALPPEARVVTRPVAAREYWERGRWRKYFAGRVFNAILIDRKVSPHDNPVDRIINAMGDRHSVILFPEGTRGSGAEIDSFKSGLYHICMRKPGLELVPVYLENLNRILPKGEFLPVPLLSSVTFGPPTNLQAGESKAAFLARTRAAVANLRRG